MLVKLGFCQLVIKTKNIFFLSDRNYIKFRYWKGYFSLYFTIGILCPGRTFSANNVLCLDPLLGTIAKFQKKRILDLPQNIWEYIYIYICIFSGQLWRVRHCDAYSLEHHIFTFSPCHDIIKLRSCGSLIFISNNIEYFFYFRVEKCNSETRWKHHYVIFNTPWYLSGTRLIT